jgi:hypothetical protein
MTTRMRAVIMYRVDPLPSYYMIYVTEMSFQQLKGVLQHPNISNTPTSIVCNNHYNQVVAPCQLHSPGTSSALI